MKILAKRLKKLREEKGESKRSIAKALNISPVTYGQYENSKRTPGLESFISIVQYFDVSADFLLGLTEDRESVEKVKKEINDLEKMNSRKELQQIMKILLQQPSEVVNKLIYINNTIIDMIK
jgi:transcriptional regulator with XRE-family HTH domain